MIILSLFIRSSDSQNDGIKKYKITIKKLENINMNSLTDFLNGKAKEVPSVTINALDILLRYHQSSIYTNIGKCFYTSEESTSISNGAQLWKGFYQSIHPTSGRMMINLDVSATAFYESGKIIYTFYYRIYIYIFIYLFILKK